MKIALADSLFTYRRLGDRQNQVLAENVKRNLEIAEYPTTRLAQQ